jgi:hypothetical protein
MDEKHYGRPGVDDNIRSSERGSNMAIEKITK